MHIERHKYGLESVTLQHQFIFVGFIHASFKAQPELHTGLALRGPAAILREHSDSNNQPMSFSGKANLIDFTVRRQRRVMSSTFGAEFDGLVDSTEQMLRLQITLHQTYSGTQQSPEDMIDLLENGGLYPR